MKTCFNMAKKSTRGEFIEKDKPFNKNDFKKWLKINKK